MRSLLAIAATFVLTAGLLFPRAADACTNPDREATGPKVTDGTGTPTSGADGGSSTAPDGSGTPTPPPDGSGSTTPPAGDTGSQALGLTWSPGNDTDGDPNNSIFFTHTGHRVSTRVVIRDVGTGRIVVDDLVSQFDYVSAKSRGTYPAITSYIPTLDPGTYEAKVQSVFSRHGEIRFGLSGQWQPASSVTKSPDISSSVTGVRFIVQPPRKGAANGSADGTMVFGGCSSGAIAGMLSGLSMLALALRKRRHE